MAVSKAQRAKSSPIKSGPNKGKEPITDKAHARNAMARLDQVNPPLTSEEKKAVARSVERKLGHSTAATRKILGKRK